MKDLIAYMIKENLVDHAEAELKNAGLFDKDSDYDGMLGKAVLELMKVFSKQGHSGYSAHLTLDLFDKLANFSNLTPITDNPEEWMEVTDKGPDGKGMWQNKRNPSMFSKDGGKTYYDVDDEKKEEVKSLHDETIDDVFKDTELKVIAPEETKAGKGRFFTHEELRKAADKGHPRPKKEE